MEEKRYTDDRSILRGCIERDEAAWEALVGRYSALISIAIRRRLASYNFSLPADEIRDISQGVLEKLWSGDSLDKIKNADSLPYWLAMV